MPTVNINGLRIHVESAGEGEPVVLVHGSWGDHLNWDPLVAEIPEGFRVIRYDRRGHSRSERPPGQGNVGEDVADLAAIVETVARGPAHVVGNSFGASIALRLAASRPELLRSLAVHEPPLWELAPDEPGVRSLDDAVRPVLRRLAAGDWEGGARTFAEAIVFGPGAWDAGMPDRLKATFLANAPTFLDESRDPEAYGIDTARLAAFTEPTLLSAGDRSAPGFHAVIERLAAALPHAERAMMAEAGHVPYATHPAEYAALLTSFWARSAGRRRSRGAGAASVGAA